MEWLAELVASLAPHVDHLVAVDGAYGLYAGGAARSATDQAQVIVGACAGASIGVTLHQPPIKWLGNETEKRSALFRLAHAEAMPGVDWLLVIDADETLLCAPDLRLVLDETSNDVGEVLLGDDGGWSPARRLFRAQLNGIRVMGQHFFYVGDDDRCLWGTDVGCTPAEQAWPVRIRHRTRPLNDRRRRQEAYYAVRDELGIERDALATP